MVILSAIFDFLGNLLKNWKVLVVLAVLLSFAGGAFAINRFVHGYQEQIAEKEAIIAKKDNEINNLKVDLLESLQTTDTLQAVILNLKTDLASSEAERQYLDTELDKSIGSIAAMKKRLADNAAKEKDSLYSGDATVSQKAVEDFNVEINRAFSDIGGND